MAITLANIQKLSNMLHYYENNIRSKNEEARGIFQSAITIVDAELKVQGGVIQLDPKVVG